MSWADAKCDEPWELPRGWEWIKAGDFAAVVGGSTPRNAADERNFEKDGAPWITPADLSGYGHATIVRGARSLSETGMSSCSATPLPRGSVLISSRAPIGYCVVAECSLSTNQGFKSLILKDCIDPFYIRYFVIYSKERFVQYASGTTFKEISGSTLAAITFPLPPLAEQRRIVARIDALFAEIAEGEAALARARAGLETFRRALLKAAVTGELTTQPAQATAPVADLLAKIRHGKEGTRPLNQRERRGAGVAPRSFENLPKLPGPWGWISLYEIGDVSGGLTKNPQRENLPHVVPYLRVANVQAGWLDLTEVKTIRVTESERVRAGLQPFDLLVVEGNGSIDQIGRCALWSNEIDGCVHQNHIIKVRFGDPDLARWCLFWLRSPHGREEIEKVAASTSGLHTLSISKIQALPVPIPPRDEMLEILRRVSAALAAQADTLALLDAEAADAARLRQAVLKAAFEGRLVPQDPTDEPARALLERLAANPAATAPRRRGRPKRTER